MSEREYRTVIKKKTKSPQGITDDVCDYIYTDLRRKRGIKYYNIIYDDRPP